VDRLAMDAVMAGEASLGYAPRDVIETSVNYDLSELLVLALDPA
jgi:hypothetical protein